MVTLDRNERIRLMGKFRALARLMGCQGQGQAPGRHHPHC
jgi:hypothetical protein